MKKEVIITLSVTAVLFTVAVLSFTLTGGFKKSADTAVNNSAQYDASSDQSAANSSDSSSQQSASTGTDAGNSSPVTSSSDSSQSNSTGGKTLTEAEKKSRIDKILKEIEGLKE